MGEGVKGRVGKNETGAGTEDRSIRDMDNRDESASDGHAYTYLTKLMHDHSDTGILERCQV